MKELKQSSTSYPITFLLVQSADHVTPLTGATPTVTLSKNGGAFGAAAGAVSEIGNGWYALAGNATDRNTLGSLLVHVTATSADPNDDRYYIVPWDPFDANLSLTNLDAAVSSRSTYAGADTSGTTTLLSRLSSGRATNLDNLDAAISSRSTYAGADTSGTTTLLSRLTSGRAANLDNLDAAVSTRSTYAGADTAGTTTLLSRIASALTITGGKVDVNDKTGFSLSSAGIQAIWDALTSALTTVGSIGKLLVDNIDAAISSVSTYAGGDTPGTTTLLSRLTGTRAGYMDNLTRLDANVSSRSTYAGADTSGTTTLLSRLTGTRASNLDNLDAAVSTRSTYAGGDTSGTTTLLARLTSTRAGYLDNLTNLDAPISGIATGDTSGVTTLLSRLTSTRATYLDNLTRLDVTVSSRSTYAGGYVLGVTNPVVASEVTSPVVASEVTSPVTVGTNNDKTGYSLTDQYGTLFLPPRYTPPPELTAPTGVNYWQP